MSKKKKKRKGLEGEREHMSMSFSKNRENPDTYLRVQVSFKVHISRGRRRWHVSGCTHVGTGTRKYLCQNIENFL